MRETVIQINEHIQAAKSKEGKYLAFIFLEGGQGLELEVLGWTRFKVPRSRLKNILGIVHLWGHEVPIIQRKDVAKLTETTCVIIFEYPKPYKHYLGNVVDGIVNVMNIAEKDPATTTIIETEVEDQLGAKQVQYGIVEINKSAIVPAQNYYSKSRN